MNIIKKLAQESVLGAICGEEHDIKPFFEARDVYRKQIKSALDSLIDKPVKVTVLNSSFYRTRFDLYGIWCSEGINDPYCSLKGAVNVSGIKACLEIDCGFVSYYPARAARPGKVGGWSPTTGDGCLLWFNDGNGPVLQEKFDDVGDITNVNSLACTNKDWLGFLSEMKKDLNPKTSERYEGILEFGCYEETESNGEFWAPVYSASSANKLIKDPERFNKLSKRAQNLVQYISRLEDLVQDD